MTSLLWEPGWAERPCRFCPHLLGDHLLKLVSSADLNHRRATCEKCDCVLTNYGG